MMENGSGKRIMDALRAKLNEIIYEEKELIVERTAAQETTSAGAITASILGTLIAIATGLIVGFFIIKGILTPLNATNAILDDIAQGQGDLTIGVPVETKDEIGDMARSFNQFMDKLSNMIKLIAKATNDLSEEASTTAKATQKISKPFKHKMTKPIPSLPLLQRWPLQHKKLQTPQRMPPLQ